jgi:hypothetical protein
MATASKNQITTKLTPPWSDDPCLQAITQGRLADQATAAFIAKRTELHETFIRETEKTRRLCLMLAAFLLALACCIPVFAPAGRETLSWGISLALFVFAAGAMGYTAISIRTKKRELRLTSS